MIGSGGLEYFNAGTNTFDKEILLKDANLSTVNADNRWYNYNEKVLGKVEIHRKQIQGALVVLEYTIKVKNNGEIYKGDASKVFDYGYCHGKKGNSGIGMHSVKRNIIELGGSIEFVPTPNEKYHITYKLTIPKDGN